VQLVIEIVLSTEPQIFQYFAGKGNHKGLPLQNLIGLVGAIPIGFAPFMPRLKYLKTCGSVLNSLTIEDYLNYYALLSSG